MEEHKPLDDSIFVILGSAGDLTARKLIPALYNLFLDHLLPGSFEVIGVDRVGQERDSFLELLRQGVARFSRRGEPDPGTWSQFAARVSLLGGDLVNPETYLSLAKRLADRERETGIVADHIFYLAVPPALIEPISKGLAKARLNLKRRRARIVVEKPFGKDLESARRLNQELGALFTESQIYRIDHYLGKETVQNILTFRFGNTLFEPIWNRNTIDHIQITVAEDIGVEHRGSYYDQAGALCDMIQNHLLQILCLVAMEAPVSFDDNEVRNKKVDVLHAIRSIPVDLVHQCAVRGQYGTGWVEGQRVGAYRSEPSVKSDSCTETYAAIKLFVDNWRWQDVPFYLRTGKRLPSKISEICIQFRPVPHQTFPSMTLLDWRPNRLLLAIYPNEGIFLRFEVKQPGPIMRLAPVMMQFYYQEVFHTPPSEAYETLLLDVIGSDATLFLRADQAEAGWAVLAPIQEVWKHIHASDFPNYQAGTWGPEEAEALIARDGRTWAIPVFIQCREDIATCRVVPSLAELAPPP